MTHSTGRKKVHVAIHAGAPKLMSIPFARVLVAHQLKLAFANRLSHRDTMQQAVEKCRHFAMAHRTALYRSAYFLGLLLFAQTGFADNLQDKTVRVVYLVSQDRQVRPDFQQALEKAIRELQQWYGQQLNGPTFRLHHPAVEVAHAAQNANWFYQHPHGDNQDDWGFNNTLAEASRLLGARFNDPHYIWVIYSDGPGNKGRGTSGVCCLPEDDLLGLVGQHPTQKKPARWVGGLGHELGHAFGLPHPADTKKDADAIMWAGFYDQYPGKAYLTESDKQILLHSPFFFDTAGKSVIDGQPRLEGAIVSPTGPVVWPVHKSSLDQSSKPTIPCVTRKVLELPMAHDMRRTRWTRMEKFG